MAQEAPDSEVGGDTNLSKIEIPLNQGIWNPDGIATGDRVDYSDITNFRYTDNGLKAVDGYQRINTTAVPSYPYIKSLYQYTSDGVTDYSMLLAQADDGAGNSVVIQNNSTVPYSGTNAPFVSYAELITNGGFETTGGWTGGTITNADFHNGTQSISWASANITTDASSYFKIYANTVYTLTFWVKSSSLFRVTVWSASGTSNKMPVYKPDFSNYKAGEWSYVEISFISTQDISDALILFSNKAAGTIYIDDVSLNADYMIYTNNIYKSVNIITFDN